MGGGGGSSKKTTAAATPAPNPNTFPENVNPFTPMANAPWAANPGKFTPQVPPMLLDQLLMAFSPSYAQSITSPINLPPLPTKASSVKKD